MSRKAFLVQVELDIQAVTCPGVWLCTNGKVSLQIYMLDSCVQTGSYKPNFPIKCNENFVFYKTFYSKHQLNELQRDLNDQWLYIELVQWQTCETGNVLATFQTTLDELLYPSTINGSIAGVDLDLLMEPSKIFPGTIAPKIEVSTKTTIEETLCMCTKPASSTVIVNPKVLTSTNKPRGTVRRKVCHSLSYSRRQPPFKRGKGRPPFCYRRAEDDLILRKPQYDVEGKYCSCRQTKSLERKNVSLRKPKSKCKRNPNKLCSCGSGHKENFCPVCSKYSGYFNLTAVEISPEPKNTESPAKPRTTLFSDNQKCHGHPAGNRCPCCRPIAFSVNEELEKSDSDTADPDCNKNKICFCTPKKPTLAEKLHARLTRTLNSLPRTIEWSCGDYDYECNCCDCSGSPAEVYRDLQKFYGDLYRKARSSTSRVCVPECAGLKSAC